MNIVGIPALTQTYENYIWVMHNQSNAWVIDPGESAQVLDYLKQHKLKLNGILITHKHHDHINGVEALIEEFTGVDIYGPSHTKLDFVSHACKQGDCITLADDLAFSVVEIPGHTPDHICFYNDKYIFTGDTIFTGGCGRILGGTPEQFANSLLKLRALPDGLELFSAHEYTNSNLAFARLVEPNNTELNQRIESTYINYPSLHQGAQSSLGLEKATNPFLRFDLEPVKSQLLERGAQDNAASLFEHLRAWKDEFDKQN